MKDVSAKIETILRALPAAQKISPEDREHRIKRHTSHIKDAANLLTRLEMAGDLDRQQPEAAKQLAPIIKCFSELAKLLSQKDFSPATLTALESVGLLDGDYDLNEEVSELAVFYHQLATRLTIKRRRGPTIKEEGLGIAHAASAAYTDITGKSAATTTDGERASPFIDFLRKVFNLLGIQDSAASMAETVRSKKNQTIRKKSPK